MTGLTDAPGPAERGRTRRVVVGTRGSPLALAQTRWVAAALRHAGAVDDLTIQVIATEGDRNQGQDLASWGQGVFARDIELALLRGEIDLAVHSLKDLPAALPDGLAIVAVPRRGSAGDVLVTVDGRSLDDLPSGARVGTSSLRRAAFLRAYRPDLDYLPVRGNVDTRWRKLLDPAQGYDALVLAAAGLERLALDEVPRFAIPFDILLPAPGQGALGLEARSGDDATASVASLIDDPTTIAAVRAERHLLHLLEGGCRLPVAALCRPETGGGLRLAAAVAAPDGARVLRRVASGPVQAPEALAAEMAAALLAGGAAELLRLAGAAANAAFGVTASGSSPTNPVGLPSSQPAPHGGSSADPTLEARR